MAKYSNIYSFTNENLSCLQKLYDFENKKVLTVLGSGDQYFSSLLFGAKDVEVFDLNALTWYYFVLKFIAIRNLDFNEFYHFCVETKYDDLEIYKKLRNLLPDDVRMYFDYLKEVEKPFSNNLFAELLFKIPEKGDGTKIPYFSKERYKKLQGILQHTDLPIYFNCDILNLDRNKYYDLLLFSNIYDYMSFSIAQFKSFLSEFNALTIEANYAWRLFEEEKRKFIANGFFIDYVEPFIKDQKTKDCVLTLRK